MTLIVIANGQRHGLLAMNTAALRLRLAAPIIFRWWQNFR
jgi:hypothetical protein